MVAGRKSFETKNEDNGSEREKKRGKKVVSNSKNSRVRNSGF